MKSQYPHYLILKVPITIAANNKFWDVFLLNNQNALWIRVMNMAHFSPWSFCLIWFFTSHQQSFSYKGMGLPGLNQYYARINVLAHGHNAVTLVRLKPEALRSRVKHSTTEPLHSLTMKLKQLRFYFCVYTTHIIYILFSFKTWR